MLPQNGQQRQPAQQGLGGGGFPVNAGGFDSPGYFNLDASQAAKQMAALTAAKQARMGVNARASPAAPGGTSSGPYLGGINNPNSFPPQNDPSRFQISVNNAPQPLLEPSMSQPGPNSRTPVLRQQPFLQGLANHYHQRGQPLPPQLTGIHSPNYDPNNSPWSGLEIGSEPGNFRLAGKEVNLFKLWTLVLQNGGGNGLTTNNSWPLLLSHFDLPEEVPLPHGGANSVAAMLRQHYMTILLSFEEAYKKNVQSKADMASRQGMNPGMLGRPGGPPQGMPNNTAAQMQRNMAGNPQGLGGPGTNGFPATAQQSQRPQTGMAILGADGIMSGTHTPEPNLLDQDPQGIKRKLDVSELDGKRARPRTGDAQPGSPMSMPTLDRHPSETPSQVASAPATAPQRRGQRSRRKIEYLPLAREIETYGGRDLRVIEAETGHTTRRPLRDLNDWGMVDIECLTLSIRSRLGTELSYALTTFTLLSTMKGQSAGSGFPIYQCLDLLEETLDLVEDMAWGNFDQDVDTFEPSSSIITHHQILDAIMDEQNLPFTSLAPRHGFKSLEEGPQQRPANYILAASNVVRNLALVNDNVDFLARQTRILDVFLRACRVVEEDGIIKPASLALSLNDVILLRKDTLYILSALVGVSPIAFPDHPANVSIRVANRIFELAASYLVDPSDCFPPLQSVQLIGVPSNADLRPPSLIDLSLEVLNKFSHPDLNRKLLIKSVSQDWSWQLFTCLVHRLPISDADMHLCQQNTWLSHFEKLLLMIYSLAFMAPPDLKKKMREDKGLRFKALAARLLQKCLQSLRLGRQFFYMCPRRITEILKVLDDALDPFENPVDSSAPTLSFGMGFADALESGHEKGTGLLGAYRELTWDMLTVNECLEDNVMFSELDSLLRVEYQ